MCADRSEPSEAPWQKAAGSGAAHKEATQEFALASFALPADGFRNPHKSSKQEGREALHGG